MTFHRSGCNAFSRRFKRITCGTINPQFQELLTKLSHRVTNEEGKGPEENCLRKNIFTTVELAGVLPSDPAITIMAPLTSC